MKQKIVFFDIDGTLKPYGKPVPESTKEAIRLLKQNGHLPVVCTGRTYPEVAANDWLMELEFSGMVCAAGGHVLYQGETVHQALLSQEETVRLKEILLDSGCLFFLEGPEATYYNPIMTEEVRSIWQALLGNQVPMIPLGAECFQVQKAITVKARGLREKGYLPELECRYQLLWYDEEEEVVEIISREISKATGIQTLLSYLGAAREDTYAFGDGPNDLEMLRYCACGICMGDGQAAAKAAADYVTGPCDGSGIYDACKHFGLI